MQVTTQEEGQPDGCCHRHCRVPEEVLAQRERGALVFGVSDKPDEASLPDEAQARAGMKPLHHLETLAVGEA